MNDRQSPNGSSSPSDSSSVGTTSRPQRRANARQARPRRFSFYLKWAVISLFCLTTAAVGSVGGYLYFHSDLLKDLLTTKNITKMMQTGDPFASIRPDVVFPGQHSMNVLVLGCDSDYVEHLDHPVVVKGAPGRSDAMMVAHIDFDNKTINVLSIPRDTAAPIPGLRGYHKINAAHTFGGNDLSARTVSEDFGIPIDHTISLDFDSFQKVVDKIGGVDLVVHKKLDYDDNWGNLHVHLKPGFQHLNGYKAMGYVRIRHSDNDLMRAERQHEFIEALRNQIKDPKTFKALPDAVNLVTDDIKSDFRSDSNSSGLDKELCLVNFARTLPPGNIHLATLEGDEGRSYVYAYPDKAKAIIGQMFFGGNADAVNLKIASREVVLAMNSGHRRVRVSRSHRRRTRSTISAPTRTGTSPALQDGSTNTTATEATDRTPVDGGDSSSRGDGAGSSGSGSDGGDGSGKGKGGDGSSDNQRSDSGTGTASEQSNAVAWYHTSV